MIGQVGRGSDRGEVCVWSQVGIGQSRQYGAVWVGVAAGGVIGQYGSRWRQSSGGCEKCRAMREMVRRVGRRVVGRFILSSKSKSF